MLLFYHCMSQSLVISFVTRCLTELFYIRVAFVLEHTRSDRASIALQNAVGLSVSVQVAL